MAAKITGTGSYIPKKIVTNHDLENLVDTNHDWILERTGIVERRISEGEETNSFMSIQASLAALEAASISKEDVDLLIVATVTGDMIFPSTACVIQEKMGLKNAVAMDVAAACSGFIYALDIANQYISNGRYKRALVIGSERMSHLIDWSDRNTCILFGDGAGAVVLEGGESSGGVLFTEIGSGLDAVDLLKVPGGGSSEPFDPQMKDDKSRFIKMEGREVFKKAVVVMSKLCVRLLEEAGKTPSDLKLLIPHQANIRYKFQFPCFHR